MSEERTAEGTAGALTGLGVLVTRDVRQSAELAGKLKALGAIVFEFPVIELRHPESRERLEELDAAISAIGSYDWIVFASTNAVEFFLSRVNVVRAGEQSDVSAALRGCLIGAVGEKTAERLREAGVEVNFTPREFSGEAFAREILHEHRVEGKRFLWPRTNVGEKQIKEQLEQNGATVDVVVAYETCLPSNARSRSGELRDLLDSGTVDYVTLTSTQSVRNFYSLVAASATLGSEGDNLLPHSLANDIAIATIGAETTKAAKQHFACLIIQAERSTIDGLIECIANCSSSN